MDNLIETLPGLMAPALAASLLVASTHVPLGREVLKRGIVFLDLAVAQFAALGFITASMLFHLDGLVVHLCAFISAICAACIFSALEKHGQVIQEALIGCGYVLAASISILLFANDPHGGEEINNLMAGQVLWTKWQDLKLPAIIYSLILILFFTQPNLSKKFFYPLFAICVTLAVQLVGVYLVFASLILPALAAYNKSLWLSYAVALIAIMGGLIFSALSDYPSGPVLVCAYSLSSFAIGICVGYKKRNQNI